MAVVAHESSAAQIRATGFPLAVARHDPSGKIATDFTGPSWPMRVAQGG